MPNKPSKTPKKPVKTTTPAAAKKKTPFALSIKQAKAFFREHAQGLHLPPGGGAAALTAGATPAGVPAGVRRYGVHKAIVKAGAHEPFPATSTLAALGVQAEVVKAYLEVIFICRISVTQSDTEDTLCVKEANAGC